MEKVSKEMLERVTMTPAPALADVRAMRDLCEAVLEGREALLDAIAEAEHASGPFPPARKRAAALRRILSHLEPAMGRKEDE